MTPFHRSWKNVIQRLLRQRIVVWGTEEPANLQQLCPWVREFYYDGILTRIVWKSHAITYKLVDVLRACPNILGRGI